MGASGGEMDNQNTIEGGTDGTIIGNTGNRMLVSGSSVVGDNEAIIPADETNYFFKFLLDGSSNEMSVDGSTTPVEFSNGPPAGQSWYVTEILVFLQDGGNLDATDYGAIASGLTNGVLIEQTNSSTDYEMTNIKLNLELAMLFSDKSLEGKAQGFLNDSNIFIGAFRVEPEISLTGDDSDVIKVTVRDDLTPLTLHKMAMRAWRAI